MLGHFGSRFLDNGWTDSENVYSLGKRNSRASFLLLQHIRHFCSLPPNMGLKWAYRRPRVTQMAGLIRSGGRHSHCSGYFSLQRLYFSLKMLLCITYMAGVALLWRSTVTHERFRNKWYHHHHHRRRLSSIFHATHRLDVLPQSSSSNAHSFDQETLSL